MLPYTCDSTNFKQFYNVSIDFFVISYMCSWFYWFLITFHTSKHRKIWKFYLIFLSQFFVQKQHWIAWFLRDFQKFLEFLKYDFFYSHLALITIEIIISVHFRSKQLKFRRFSLKIPEIKVARNLNLTRVTIFFY